MRPGHVAQKLRSQLPASRRRDACFHTRSLGRAPRLEAHRLARRGGSGRDASFDEGIEGYLALVRLLDDALVAKVDLDP